MLNVIGNLRLLSQKFIICSDKLIASKKIMKKLLSCFYFFALYILNIFYTYIYLKYCIYCKYKEQFHSLDFFIVLFWGHTYLCSNLTAGSAFSDHLCWGSVNILGAGDQNGIQNVQSKYTISYSVSPVLLYNHLPTKTHIQAHTHHFCIDINNSSNSKRSKRKQSFTFLAFYFNLARL